MENSKTNSNLKTAVVILALAFLGTGGYLYKVYMDSKVEKEKLTVVENDKAKVMSDLLKVNADLNKAISENSSMTDQLTAERQKVVDLINELNASKTTVSSLMVYKRRADSYESRIQGLLQEIADLKRENNSLRTERDSSVTALKAYIDGTRLISGPNGFNNKNKIENTAKSNSKKNGMSAELAEKLYRIDILNLNAEALKSLGVATETTTMAKDANYVNVSFTLPQSFVVRASERKYYVQILDKDNVVMGDTGEETLDDNVKLKYSFIKSVDYKNRVLKVNETVLCKNLKKGDYTVKVFDKGRLVGTKVFTLK